MIEALAISSWTLRVWERRYRIVGPRVDARGRRLYSAEDVGRLALIRQLVDLGSPIGSVASLPLASLRDMRSAAAASHGVSVGSAGSSRPVRVALVGRILTEHIAGDGALTSVLIRITRTLTTLYCECPRHLDDLLLTLGTFERYSAECANRTPEDAVLHQHLQRVAGSARVLFEDALVRVARSEGLALPSIPNDVSG